MIRKLNYINILLWTIIVVCPFLLQQAGIIETHNWKISKLNGLISIFTGSFLHGSFSHMTGNLTGILLGVSLLYNLYYKMYFKVIILGILVPSGIMYWLGLPAVGISGLVYALLWFVILRGLMSNERIKYFSAALMLVLYGASLRTAIPPTGFTNIAWQAHLGGVLVALGLAVYDKIRT